MEELVTGSVVDSDQSDIAESSHGKSSKRIETPEKSTPFDELNKKTEEFGGQLDASDLRYIFIKKREKPEVILAHVTSYAQPGMENTMFIEDLWVDTQIRGKGIASLLMRTFEQLASENGICKIRLFASGSGDLVSFYEALNYKREAPNSTIMIKELSSLHKQK